MTKEEIVRRFRTWLFRSHGFRTSLSEAEAKKLLGTKLYEALREIE